MKLAGSQTIPALTYRGQPFASARRVPRAITRLWARLSVAHRRLVVLTGGAIVAAGAAWTTAENPHASPAHGAVLIRVLIIVTLIVSGVYAQTSRMQARMGSKLIAAGFFSGVWLLNGSGNRFLFS